MAAMWNIIGNQAAIAQLDRAVRSGTPAHALLLVGPPHSGKTTLASTFAQALNCTGSAPPCGICRDCRKIAAGNHPDVDVVAPGDAENPRARIIKIDRLRAMIQQASLAPTEGRYKVIIVDADAVTGLQASALLKTLEEPSPSVVFVLTAVTVEALPDAIVSRCQVLQTSPASIEELTQQIAQRLGLALDDAAAFARLSGGHTGRALDLAAHPEVRETEAEELKRLLRASAGAPFDRLTLAYQSASSPDRSIETLAIWGRWWRDALMLALGLHGAVIRPAWEADLRSFGAIRQPAILARQLRAIHRTADLIAGNVNPRLAMEALALEL